MSEQYGRIHRLLKVLSLVQSSRGWNAGRLAEACGTSVRSVYRDIRVLEAAGVPCYHDPDTGGYRVRGDFFMPPVDLTLDESLALTVLGEQVSEAGQIPFLASASRAIAKIRSQLPEPIRRDLRRIDPHISLQLAQAGTADGIRDVYDLVQEAIFSRRTLLCEYDATNSSQDDGDHPFRFHPYALFWGQRAWYAVGHHAARRGIRKLKLSRFTRIELTDDTFTLPKRFSLDKELGHAWRMIRGSKRYHVELQFDASFAETIADTHWHETQEIDWHDDGSITFRCTVDGLDEIVWWVMSMGPHCVVRKPGELAERICKMARDVLAVYEH